MKTLLLCFVSAFSFQFSAFAQLGGTLLSPQVVSSFRPASDSTSAITFFKADGTTPVLTLDSTNKRVFVGASNPAYISDDGSGGIAVDGGYFVARYSGSSIFSVNSTLLRGPVLNDSGVELTVSGGTTGRTRFTGHVKINPVAVASLPTSPTEGMMVPVTDSNTATFGATIAGGGSNHVMAYYNGTNWTVH